MKKYRKQLQDKIELAKFEIERSKLLQQKIEDIASEKVKAGQDYVTNKNVTTNLFLDAAGIPNIFIRNRATFKDEKEYM